MTRVNAPAGSNSNQLFSSRLPRVMPDREFRFTLSIPRQEYLRYYQGAAGHVVVRSYGGLRLSFPARLLRTFVTHRGVYGEFSLLIDDANRVLHLERLSSPV